MSKLEEAMNTIIDVFRGYSHKEGDSYHLSRSEMRRMFEAELGEYLQASHDPVKVGQVLAELDQNRDGQVDFVEFVAMLSKIASCSLFYYSDRPILICGVGNP